MTTEQFRFKARTDVDWSGWEDRYEGGEDQIMYPDDDDVVEYQHRHVNKLPDGEVEVVAHDWVPLRDGVYGPQVGAATFSPDGQFATARSRRLGRVYLNTITEPVQVVGGGYVTKDSGVRAEYASGMVRDTQDGKPRFDLVIPENDATEVSLFFALFLEQARREGRMHDDDTDAVAVLVDWYEHPDRGRARKTLTRIEAVIAERDDGGVYDDLLLTRWAALMGRGAEKYGDRNWEKSDGTDGALERAKGSALRHGLQWWNHETDEDHAAAVCFNIGAVDYYQGRQA